MLPVPTMDLAESVLFVETVRGDVGKNALLSPTSRADIHTQTLTFTDSHACVRSTEEFTSWKYSESNGHLMTWMVQLKGSW